MRHPLAAFNAAHADQVLGPFLEGTDLEVTQPACQRAYTFLTELAENGAAELYAERWRRRDELETQRAWQVENIGGQDALASHGLEGATLQAIRDRLDATARTHVAKLHLARRVIPADPAIQQFVVGVELTWWGRQRCNSRTSSIGWLRSSGRYP